MPQYNYFCPVKGCRKNKEVIHLMSECDTPSEDLIKETTCTKHNVRMQRQIFEPMLGRQKGGSTVSEKELLKDKQKQRKLRSKIEFMNTLDKNSRVDKQTKTYFKKKYSKVIPKKDHEKLK